MSYTERNSNVKLANLFRFGIKSFSVIILFQFLLVMGCNGDQKGSGEADRMTVVIHSGTKLSLSSAELEPFVFEIEKLFSECDDIYELLVTDQLVEAVKSENPYLEIIYPGKKVMDAGKFRNMKLDRILIPLSGKFASGESVTFFSGTGNLSNTPVINSTGSARLQEALEQIIR